MPKPVFQKPKTPRLSVHLAYSEVKGLIQWVDLHLRNCKTNLPNVTVEQCFDSGIGVNTFVKCQCGWSQDISDYELW